MALRDIANAIRKAPAAPRAEAQLRWRFHHLAAGLASGQVSLEAVKLRLKRVIELFDDPMFGAPDCNKLLRAHTQAMNDFKEGQHYQRPEQLVEHLDQRALTIQVNAGGALGAHWGMGRLAKAPDIVTAFLSGKLDGEVGPPDRPLWITPYAGELQLLCIEASSRYVPAARRAEIARAVVDILGLAQVRPRNELIALVSQRTIGELTFVRPDDDARMLPVGPTAIEARGSERFRCWPTPPEIDPYGRTYSLDRASRDRSFRGKHGVPEAVRPRMSIREFGECVYLGPLDNRTFDDADDAYLKAIGVSEGCAGVLLALAEVTGL
ncbi:hypothetical protein P1X14_13650 [Sphingomonas sp. AOB5]|uniref:hypothetical protein n=1 Tax=Sphingomonas sp. AOB5 TaxID=3034017 RepID=UPI0023F640D3|nr:hypothetical protein [Sphingomonas sp. AOB5]MDF7776295.1 hypothetical protein [Sphingomonas sp. AOB5]